jgi:hypothetical protein
VCLCMLLDEFNAWDYCATYKSDGKLDGQNKRSRMMYSKA